MPIYEAFATATRFHVKAAVWDLPGFFRTEEEEQISSTIAHKTEKEKGTHQQKSSWLFAGDGSSGYGGRSVEKEKEKVTAMATAKAKARRHWHAAKAKCGPTVQDVGDSLRCGNASTGTLWVLYHPVDNAANNLPPVILFFTQNLEYNYLRIDGRNNGRLKFFCRIWC
ncbi:hypothetical protein SO802_014053 [Lithocarpus litseifolius]|uniref:Uncharacterized protein n=1 Tax=Lithocarpus litseifolius TaxID=425828 RepID=A0AAW2D7W5_9ROSI